MIKRNHEILSHLFQKVEDFIIKFREFHLKLYVKNYTWEYFSFLDKELYSPNPTLCKGWTQLPNTEYITGKANDDFQGETRQTTDLRQVLKVSTARDKSHGYNALLIRCRRGQFSSAVVFPKPTTQDKYEENIRQSQTEGHSAKYRSSTL